MIWAFLETGFGLAYNFLGIHSTEGGCSGAFTWAGLILAAKMMGFWECAIKSRQR
jgi:hypothetical protein